jgi:hypothetical protein
MIGVRTGKLTRYEAAAMMLQPKTVVDSEVTATHLTVTGGYIAASNVTSWLGGARVAATAGTKYSNINAFAAVSANKPPGNS